MRIALLSCGESVFSSWDFEGGRNGYDLVVGVNWISCLSEVDWSCFKDVKVPEDPRFARPRCGIVAYGGYAKKWEGIEYRNFERWHEDGWPEGVLCQFTFPDALRWCLRSFPDAEVSVYGLDMDGAQGACKYGNRHDPGRWRDELPFVRFLFSRYGGRISLVGCRVERSCLLAR